MQHFVVENLTVTFGGLSAVDNLSFSINKDEIFGLIGPNGAGKSTVFNAINHFVKASAGSIMFEGVDTLKLGDHKIISSGIARTFQNIELFTSCTVMENLLIGHHSMNRTNILSGVLLLPKARREEQKARLKAMELLELLGIAEHENDFTEGLPYGVQKRVELARALMTEPRLILLDEPVAGMNKLETEELSRVILKIKDTFGMTILMVEHDMSIVMSICDRIVVMDYGKKIAEGEPEAIKRNPKVIEAYLGDMEIAEVQEIEIKYGGVHALKKATMHIPKGKIVTILGANGAGKSSLMHCAMGLVKPIRGTVEFMNEPITHLPTDERVKRGMVYIPEGRRIFPQLTVEENLIMGSYAVKDRTKARKRMEKIYTQFPRLSERKNQSGGSLSGGEQQMLAIGRGLMSEPRLLMLDEPSLGLAPVVVQQIFRIIEEINNEGVTILLVEQNAHLALNIANYGYVLQLGEVLLEGESSELTNNKEVIRLYLG